MGKGHNCGASIRPVKNRVSAEIVASCVDLPVATISDSMARMTAGGAALRPMHAGGYLAGPAFTVKTRPGDNLMVHKALDMAEPGDIVVVDAGGDLTNAIVGEIMLTYAKARGIAGVIINGAIRDTDAIAADRFPVYAVGTTHRGPYREGPGEIGGDIAIDGMVIAPGDLIVGDADGVLCVPQDAAKSVLAAATAKNDAEEKILALMKDGKLMDRAWIAKALDTAGVTYVD